MASDGEDLFGADGSGVILYVIRNRSKASWIVFFSSRILFEALLNEPLYLSVGLGVERCGNDVLYSVDAAKFGEFGTRKLGAVI